MEQVTKSLLLTTLADPATSGYDDKSFEELQQDISACISFYKMSEGSDRHCIFFIAL